MAQTSSDMQGVFNYRYWSSGEFYFWREKLLAVVCIFYTIKRLTVTLSNQHKK